LGLKAKLGTSHIVLEHLKL